MGFFPIKITTTRVILFFIFVVFLPCISGCGEEMSYGYPLPLTYSNRGAAFDSFGWNYLLIDVMVVLFFFMLVFVFTRQGWEKKETRVAATVLFIYTALHAGLVWAGYWGAMDLAFGAGQVLHLPLGIFIELFEDFDMRPLYRTDMDLPIRLSFTVCAFAYTLIAYYYTRWKLKKGPGNGGNGNTKTGNKILDTLTNMTDL